MQVIMTALLLVLLVAIDLAQRSGGKRNHTDLVFRILMQYEAKSGVLYDAGF